MLLPSGLGSTGRAQAQKIPERRERCSNSEAARFQDQAALALRVVFLRLSGSDIHHVLVTRSWRARTKAQEYLLHPTLSTVRARQATALITPVTAGSPPAAGSSSSYRTARDVRGLRRGIVPVC